LYQLRRLRQLSWFGASAAATLAIAGLAVLGEQTHEQTHVWKDSVTLWNRVLEVEPSNHVAYNNRADLRKANGDVEGALDDLNQALRFNPHYVPAYCSRGNIRRGKGDLAGALADYNQAIRLDPNYANAYNGRGRIRQARGDLDGALADYDHAIHLAPLHANAHNNRGNARRAKGDLVGAIADYAQAVQLEASGGANREMFERNLAAAQQALGQRQTRSFQLIPPSRRGP
jgi:tetratricopeptide (TPR) repeat protein